MGAENSCKLVAVMMLMMPLGPKRVSGARGCVKNKKKYNNNVGHLGRFSIAGRMILDGRVEDDGWRWSIDLHARTKYGSVRLPGRVDGRRGRELLC